MTTWSRWAKFRYRRLLKRMAGPNLLAAFAKAYPNAFFVEIGANDGEKHDFLTPHLRGGWSGIMVEPVPYVFRRLQANHGGVPGLILENLAIAAQDGSMPLYHLPEASDADDLPREYDALGSFSREVITSHADVIPDVADRIVETVVPTLRFDTLLDRHGVENVDLIVIDTEGHDWEILRTIDIERWRPRVVIYEHFHLSTGDRAAALERLRDEHGYQVLEEGIDTFAVDPLDDALTREWHARKAVVAPVSAAAGSH